jgi:hypothetical protein
MPGGCVAVPWVWKKEQFDKNVETKTFYTDWDGTYREDRVVLHNAIVDGFLGKHQAQRNPMLTLVSGGAASGKSSAAKKAFLAVPDAVAINTDDVRMELPEFPIVEGTDKAGLLQEESGDIRDRLLARASFRRANIVLDAPGSPSLSKQIDDLEQAGYQISIAYTHKPVDESKIAAAYRAKNAKKRADRRQLPDQVIEQSHQKARAGLNEMAARKNREIIVYDLTGKKIGESADVIYHRKADGTVTLLDEPKMRRFATCEVPPVELAAH